MRWEDTEQEGRGSEGMREKTEGARERAFTESLPKFLPQLGLGLGQNWKPRIQLTGA